MIDEVELDPTNPDHQKTQQLLDAARQGDRDALGMLFEHFRPFLLQIANLEISPQLKQKVGGSDLVQQSLLEAGRAFEQFEGVTPQVFVVWLRRILLNNIVNSRRFFQTDKRDMYREVRLTADTSSAMQAEILCAPSSESSCAVESEEMRRIVAEAFAELPGVSQEVIKLRGELGLSFAQVGEKIGRSAEASRKLWARAVEALRDAIDKRTSR